MAGPQCCSNPPVLDPNGGVGSVVKLGGLNSYVTGSPHSNLAILLVSDAFGYEAPNLRKLADKAAAAGFFVVVPDFFHGDPYAPENPNKPVQVWLKEHETDKAFAEAKPIIEDLRTRGVSAIGGAGFCWGAKVMTELAKLNFIQAAMLLHPSYVSLDDINEIKVPISILGAEIDPLSPPELLKKFEDALTAKSGADFYVKIFSKVAHGWSMRYKVEDEEGVTKAEEAHQDMLEWFSKFVK